MGMRRKGREIAMQTLYAIEYKEFLQTDDNEIEFCKLKLAEIAESKEITKDNTIFEFALEILLNTLAKMEEIDAKIAEHSTNWSMNKIAHLDRSILRIATYEMLFTLTAPAIVMNEAIEIAKRFCSDSSGKFINGILNSIAKELK
jgi:transcription antitermination protein NusB